MVSKVYAVAVGRRVGIYCTWKECETQVLHYSGAKYRSFATMREAETYLAEFSQSPPRPRESQVSTSQRTSPHGSGPMLLPSPSPSPSPLPLPPPSSSQGPRFPQAVVVASGAAMEMEASPSFHRRWETREGGGGGGGGSSVPVSSPPLKRGADWLANGEADRQANGAPAMGPSGTDSWRNIHCHGCGKLERHYLTLSSCGHEFSETCARECAFFGQCPCGCEMAPGEVDSCQPTQEQIASLERSPGCPLIARERECYWCREAGSVYIFLSVCGHGFCKICAQDCALTGQCPCGADMAPREVDACAVTSEQIAAIQGKPGATICSPGEANRTKVVIPAEARGVQPERDTRRRLDLSCATSEEPPRHPPLGPTASSADPESESQESVIVDNNAEGQEPETQLTIAQGDPRSSRSPPQCVPMVLVGGEQPEKKEIAVAPPRPPASEPSPVRAESDDFCAICMTKKKNATLIPCGHVFCLECATICHRRNRWCPTCRRKSTRVLKLFLN